MFRDACAYLLALLAATILIGCLLLAARADDELPWYDTVGRAQEAERTISAPQWTMVTPIPFWVPPYQPVQQRRITGQICTPPSYGFVSCSYTYGW